MKQINKIKKLKKEIFEGFDNLGGHDIESDWDDGYDSAREGCVEIIDSLFDEFIKKNRVKNV